MIDSKISSFILDDFKEYNIKYNNNIYNLRIEINKDIQKIFFKLNKSNDPINYIFKNELNLIDFSNNLKLNIVNNDLVLSEFDNIYKNNHILINIKDDNHFILTFITNKVEKSSFEIILNKEIMNIEDKFNFLYSQINLIKNENIKLLNLKMNKKEDDIKNIINEKDIIIK